MIPRCASVSGRPPRPPSGPPPAHGARTRRRGRTRHPVPNSHAQGHGWRRWPAIGAGVRRLCRPGRRRRHRQNPPGHRPGDGLRPTGRPGPVPDGRRGDHTARRSAAAGATGAHARRRCCMNTLWGWGRASWAGCGPDVRRGGQTLIMGYSADKSPLIGHLAGPIRRLEPLGAQRQEKCGPNRPTPTGYSCNNAARTDQVRSPRERPNERSSFSEV